MCITQNITQLGKVFPIKDVKFTIENITLLGIGDYNSDSLVLTWNS